MSVRLDVIPNQAFTQPVELTSRYASASSVVVTGGFRLGMAIFPCVGVVRAGLSKLNADAAGEPQQPDTGPPQNNSTHRAAEALGDKGHERGEGVPVAEVVVEVVRLDQVQLHGAHVEEGCVGYCCWGLGLGAWPVRWAVGSGRKRGGFSRHGGAHDVLHPGCGAVSIDRSTPSKRPGGRLWCCLSLAVRCSSVNGRGPRVRRRPAATLGTKCLGFGWRKAK